MAHPKNLSQKIDSLLIDTSYWVSLFWSEDQNHQSAQKLSKKVSGKFQLLTTEDILKETLTVISQRCGKKESNLAYESIYSQCEVIQTDHETFSASLSTFFLPKLQKDISVIDCETANIAKDTDIDFILTFDPHFSYLGCKVYK